MPNLRIPLVLHDLILKAVIICDDFAFASKADATLRRVGYQAGADIQWIIKCWPVNALKDTVLAQETLAETLDAHLIIFPARCAQSLPSWVLDWLESWATQRKIQAAALGVINDADATVPPQIVHPRLSRIIHQHDLNFIIDERCAVEETVKIPIRSSSQRNVPLPIEQEVCLDPTMRNSFRAYGINE